MIPELGVLDWGLLVLVAFPLLQLPLVVYLSRYVETDGETALDHAVEFHEAPSDSVGNRTDVEVEVEGECDQGRTRSPRSQDAPSEVVCPSCGIGNDPTFRFCRRCVARLSGGRPVAASPPY